MLCRNLPPGPEAGIGKVAHLFLVVLAFWQVVVHKTVGALDWAAGFSFFGMRAEAELSETDVKIRLIFGKP